MIYWTTKNIQKDTQVPRQNTNTCPKKLYNYVVEISIGLHY